MKITFIIALFTIILVSGVATFNYFELKENIIKQDEVSRQLIEDSTTNAVKDVETALELFDGDVEKRMHDHLLLLNEKYNENPDFDTWDFEELKTQFEGMDVYILNNKSVITHTNFAKDKGLDFRVINPGFAEILEAGLKKGDFWADKLAIEDMTGEARKYAYLPTDDGKYLIEIGMYLKESETFSKFNYKNVATQLEKEYPIVTDVTTYLGSNVALGETDAKGEVKKIEEKRFKNDVLPLFAKKGQKIFHETAKDGTTYTTLYKTSEYENRKYDEEKVIEIVYNDKELQKVLKKNQEHFAKQLLIGAVVSILASLLVSRIIARPLFLAFHDTLTGLSNRASFEVLLQDTMKKAKKGEKAALMVLDLDNFKKVNDESGHDVGDILLKEVGRRVKASLRNIEDVAARLGGDEFTVILSNIKSEEQAIQVAQRIIEELKRPIMVGDVDITQKHDVTASIGIALIPEQGKDAQEIYKVADIAMYNAKTSGKNGYRIYHSDMKGEEK